MVIVISHGRVTVRAEVRTKLWRSNLYLWFKIMILSFNRLLNQKDLTKAYLTRITQVISGCLLTYCCNLALIKHR